MDGMCHVYRGLSVCAAGREHVKTVRPVNKSRKDVPGANQTIGT